MVLTSKFLTITKVEFLQDLEKSTEISDSWLNHWSFWWMSSKPRCCSSIRSNWWKADHPQPRGWKVSSRSSKRRGALINCLGHAGHNVHHSFSWCDMILWCQSHNTWCLQKWRMDFRWSPCGNSMKQMRRTWVLPFLFSIGRLVAGLPISDGIACETSMNSQVHWGDYVRRRTRAISRLCSQPQRKIVEFQRKFLSSGNFSVFVRISWQTPNSDLHGKFPLSQNSPAEIRTKKIHQISTSTPRTTSRLQRRLGLHPTRPRGPKNVWSVSSSFRAIHLPG